MGRILLLPYKLLFYSTIQRVWHQYYPDRRHQNFPYNFLLKKWPKIFCVQSKQNWYQSLRLGALCNSSHWSTKIGSVVSKKNPKMWPKFSMHNRTFNLFSLISPELAHESSIWLRGLTRGIDTKNLALILSGSETKNFWVKICIRVPPYQNFKDFKTRFFRKGWNAAKNCKCQMMHCIG